MKHIINQSFLWKYFLKTTIWIRASLIAQLVKNLSAMQEIWVWSLGWEDPLEKGMVIHSSIFAWRIPWTEEPGRLQSLGSQRVGHDWATKEKREMDKNKHAFASVTAITTQDYNQKSLCLKGALNTCRCWQIQSVGSVSFRTNCINSTHLLKTCFILISQRASPFHWWERSTLQ